MNHEDKKKKLEALGVETLAKALLDLSLHDERADELMERLMSTPDEIIKSFKAKLSGLKRSRRFIPWGESAGFAKELIFMLEDLQAGVRDPCKGAKLVADFYEIDRSCFERCDDSSGHVGDVFRYEAAAAFSGYACHCEDKDWLAKLLVDLNSNDEYDVRIHLIERASEFLPETSIREMAATLDGLACREPEQYRRRHWLHCVETLAMQMQDAEMFEKARLASYEKVSTATSIDIAKAYLAAGKASISLGWLDRISPDEKFMAEERDQLLLEIYLVLGNHEGEREVAWRIFKRSRNDSSFKTLLKVIGEDQRDVILEREVQEILQPGEFSYTDAEFLISTGRINETEEYVLQRSEQINGDFYQWLIPVVEVLESSAKWLGATVIYRALLDSILRRARTKTYPYGVKYLKTLGRISANITDWKSIENHVEYFERLRQNHGKKTSFWKGFA